MFVRTGSYSHHFHALLLSLYLREMRVKSEEGVMRLVILGRSDFCRSYVFFFIAFSMYPWILGSEYIEIYFLY